MSIFRTEGGALGFTVIRVAIGASFIAHGWPKLMGGPEKWEGLGGVMGMLGITFAPTFWGFSAAAAETVGGALLVLGLLTRPAAAALAFTMFVAFYMHFQNGDGFGGWSHAAESMAVFVGIMLAGAGPHSLDARIFGEPR